MNKYKFSELKLGLSETFITRITQEKMAGFLAASGDNNPLHVNDTFSKSRGYKHKVVYGMLTASLYSTLVGVYLPGENGLLQGIDVTFRKPVFEGDELKVYGEISYINEVFKQIEITARIENQDKEKVSKAKIKVGIYE
jgi:3-hydroxybutyryl-CoA dehydratase